MRIWARIFRENQILKDMVVENNEEDTRTHKVFDAVAKVTYAFDLPAPIWLEANINEFKKFQKVRFGQDSFVEEVPFDYLEFIVLEED